MTLTIQEIPNVGVALGAASPAAASVRDFVHLPVAQGAPTGVPMQASGYAPIVLTDGAGASATALYVYSPAAAAWRSLTLASTAGVSQLGNGAVGAPSLNFINSPTTGLYRGGADILSVAIAGAEIARLSAAGLGGPAGGALTIQNGLTVTAGGLTVTAGGETITAGGLTVTAGGILSSAGAGTTTQVGIDASPTLSTAATTAMYGIRSLVTGAAGSYATTTIAGVQVDTIVLGASQTATAVAGIQIAAQTAVCTNAVGITIGAVSGGATTNIGLNIAAPTGTGAMGALIAGGLKVSTGGAILSGAALAQGATSGFTYIPTISTGAPNGIPAAQTGCVAMAFLDNAGAGGFKLYIYSVSGAAWKSVTLA